MNGSYKKRQDGQSIGWPNPHHLSTIISSTFHRSSFIIQFRSTFVCRSAAAAFALGSMMSDVTITLEASTVSKLWVHSCGDGFNQNDVILDSLLFVAVSHRFPWSFCHSHTFATSIVVS